MTLRRSAFSCISPALDRMTETCFRPFRFAVWARLALIVFLAGEVGSHFNLARWPGRHTARAMPPMPHIAMHTLAVAAAGFAIFLLALFIVFAYLNARARFVLMESVFARTCRLAEMWGRWRGPAGIYFVFNLVLVACAWAILIPVGFSFYRAMAASGVFTGGSVTPGVLFGHLAGTVALLLTASLVLALINVFAKDFLVPVLALERHDLGSGVSRLGSLMEVQPAAFVVYIVAKIVLTIVTAILMIIVIVPVMLVLAIPLVIVAVPLVLLMKSGMALFALGLAIVLIVFVPLIVFVVSFVYVPVAIFFEAWALEFFSGWFPPLAAILHPPVPVAPLMPLVPAAPLLPGTEPVS